MKGLAYIEIQWLEAFAKKHEFFASFLLHYKLKQYLPNNQYYWLHLYINQAEEQGDTILSAEEIKFMEEFSETNERLSEILKMYEDKGFLDKTNCEAFFEIKLNSSSVFIQVVELDLIDNSIYFLYALIFF